MRTTVSSTTSWSWSRTSCPCTVAGAFVRLPARDFSARRGLRATCAQHLSRTSCDSFSRPRCSSQRPRAQPSGRTPVRHRCTLAPVRRPPSTGTVDGAPARCDPRPERRVGAGRARGRRIARVHRDRRRDSALDRRRGGLGRARRPLPLEGRQGERARQGGLDPADPRERPGLARGHAAPARPRRAPGARRLRGIHGAHAGERARLRRRRQAAARARRTGRRAQHRRAHARSTSRRPRAACRS